MSLFLDSARVEEVKQAMALGFVRGVTTNPTLMAQVKERPEEVIRQICELAAGPVFYQLTSKTAEEREREAYSFFEIRPEKVVLKIPMTTENMTLVDKLPRHILCAATAVFSGYQTFLACEAGVKYVIPYVNRSTRLLGDGCALVREMASVIAASRKPVEIVAASVKSPEEAVQAVLAGAHHLTLPLDVMLSMGQHRLSDEAIAEFQSRRPGTMA